MTNMKVSAQIPAKDIETFDISQDSGFLKPRTIPIALHPHNPALAIWEIFAKNLKTFYSIHSLAEEVANLPDFPISTLAGNYHERAFQILTWTISGLVHPYRNQEVGFGQIIPAKLAIPVCHLAMTMDRLPILSYEEYCLNNCVVTGDDVNRSNVEIPNLHLQQPLVNVQDERGFITPHQAMEWKGAPIPANAGIAQEYVLNNDNLQLKSLLWKMSGAAHEMISQQLLMWKYCRPEYYPLEVRPQIQRFENVVYDGVTTPPFDKPISLRGETGAQSPLFRTIDALIGVKHQKTDLTDHLDEMGKYMTPKHRQFIRAVEAGPSVRDYILKAGESDGELNDAYNSLVYAMITLRNNHFDFMKYIPRTGDGQLGTGGMPIYKFLPQFIEETKEHLIRRRR